MMALAPVTDLVIRRYGPADEEAVLALLRQSMGEGRPFERSAEFWRWKHLANPFGQSLLMVAESRTVGDGPGRIVGVRAYMRWTLRIGSRAAQAVRAVDTATHPGFRRTGVFTTLNRAALEEAREAGVALVFNTPNAMTLRGDLKMGWSYLGRPPLLVRVVRPLRLAAAAMGAVRRHSARPAVAPSWPQREDPARDRVAPVLATREDVVEAVLAANDRLLAGGIRTARTTAYLRWRYAQAPAPLRYHVHMRHGAMAVVRLAFRGGLREVMVSELVAGPEGLRDAPALIRDIIGATGGDYLVAHAHPGSPHWWALLRSGFVPVPRVGVDLAARPLETWEGPPIPIVLSAWRLSLGDLEVF